MKTHVHNALEAQMSHKTGLAAILVQTATRRFVCWRLFIFYKFRVNLVQRWWRGEKARKFAKSLREAKASLVLCKNLRMAFARRRFLVLTTGVRRAQYAFRRLVSLRSRAALRIQTAFRRHHAEGVLWGMIKCFTTLQNSWRSILAVRTRKKVKAEGRDIGKLAEENNRVRQEMLALKSMLKVQQQKDEKTQQLKVTTEDADMWKLKYETLRLQKAMEAAAQPPTPPGPGLEGGSKSRSPHQRSSSVDRPVLLKSPSGGERGGGNRGDAVVTIDRLHDRLRKEISRRIAAEREVIALRNKISGVKLTEAEIDELVQKAASEDDDNRGEEEDEEFFVSPKPKPRSAARIEMRRSSSATIVIDKKEIMMNSAKLVEDEAKKIGNVWKDNWDDDEAESEEEEDNHEDVSRMQKTLKLRSARRGEGSPGGEESAKATATAARSTAARSTATAATAARPTAARSTAARPTPRKAATSPPAATATATATIQTVTPETATTVTSSLLALMPRQGASSCTFFNAISKYDKLSVLRYKFNIAPSFALAHRSNHFSLCLFASLYLSFYSYVSLRVLSDLSFSFFSCCCRDEVRRFEQKMDRFTSEFQEGLDLTLWQANKNSLADSDDEDEFTTQASPVTARLDMRDSQQATGLLTASIQFLGRKGFLRTKSVFGVLANKIGGGDGVLRPLPLHEILDVRAGAAVVGGARGHFSSPSKSPLPKKASSKDFILKKEFQNGGLFMTIVAVATPATPQRVFLLKFTSRQDRNDALSGMRKLLADVQIVNSQAQTAGASGGDADADAGGGGGVGGGGGGGRSPGGSAHMGASSPFRSHANEHAAASQSIFRKKGGKKGAGGDGDAMASAPVTTVYGSGGEKGARTMVLLSDVHRQLSKERSAYERVMVQMLQATFDLQEKEDEMLGLVEALEREKKKEGRSRRSSGGHKWWGGGGGKGGPGGDREDEEEKTVVMQLSRKLEELLIDNEDLREQIKDRDGIASPIASMNSLEFP